MNRLKMVTCGLSLAFAVYVHAKEVQQEEKAQHLYAPARINVLLRNGKHVVFVPQDAQARSKESAFWIAGRIGARIVRFSAIAWCSTFLIYLKATAAGTNVEIQQFFGTLMRVASRQGAYLGMIFSIPDAMVLFEKGYQFGVSKWYGKTADERGSDPEAEEVEEAT